MNFSIEKYFFGKKDYLITYINGNSYYKSQIGKVYSTSEIVNRILLFNYSTNPRKSDRVIKQVYGFITSNNDSLRLQTEDTIVVKTLDGFDIVCYAFHGYNKKLIEHEKELIIYGLLDNFDPSNKKIEFKNCFLEIPFGY